MPFGNIYIAIKELVNLQSLQRLRPTDSLTKRS